MAIITGMIPLFLLEKDGNRGSFRADKPVVESNRYLSNLDTKTCMEQPDPLWQLLRAKGQEQGGYAEKKYNHISKSKSGRRVGFKGAILSPYL